MSEEHSREVPVTFVEGVHEDVASLIASLTSEARHDVGEHVLAYIQSRPVLTSEYAAAKADTRESLPG